LNVSSVTTGHSIFALTPGNPFWPWFAGIAILTIGLIANRKDISSAHRLEKLLALGPLFFAAPMAVFASQHFTDAQSVSTIVPSWMPWHTFWTYFVAVSLIAAALAIALRKQARLAAALLAVTLILFVLLLHIPNILAHSRSILTWAVAFRDLVFSGGALALAATPPAPRRARGTAPLIIPARLLIAVPVIFFGAAHLLRPGSLPACDLDQRTPAWMPGHTLWAYCAGIIFIVLGTTLLLNRKTHLAAVALGIAILGLLLCVYLPLVASKPADIANGLDYFVSTLAFSGVALLLAAATRREHAVK
jgi:uncharacterized membrane protein YphA (DoxX/SURF4 family)